MGNKRTAPEQLIRWRQKVALSQTQAAEWLGVQQATWSRWERGLQAPPLRYAVRLQEITGIPATAWASDAFADFRRDAVSKQKRRREHAPQRRTVSPTKPKRSGSRRRKVA